MEKLSITVSELELLLPAVVFGAEGDGDDSDDNSDDNGDDNGAEDSDDDNDDDSDKDDKGKEDVSGLKSALAKERAARAKAEKALKSANKAKEDAALAEKSELEQAQIKEKAASEKAEKLAAGLLRTRLDAKIERIAEKMGFVDTDDVIAGVERKDFVYTQDDDDPSDIEIDEKSIKVALEALAKKKQHWLKSEDDSDGDQRTGGQFGRGGKKKTPTTDEVYRERYPNL